MPLTPHVERHFTAGETVRDVVIGMSDGLTVPFALAAGLAAGGVRNALRRGGVPGDIVEIGPCTNLKLDWRDAFLNAAMLLGGMGPVESPQTPGGKVFAGLVFLILAGVLLVPVIHRVPHRFHWDASGGPDAPGD